jgi:hypothetical protein
MNGFIFPHGYPHLQLCEGTAALEIEGAPMRGLNKQKARSSKAGFQVSG